MHRLGMDPPRAVISHDRVDETFDVVIEELCEFLGDVVGFPHFAGVVEANVNGLIEFEEAPLLRGLAGR